MANNISLIIPCYNDSARLAQFLPSLCEVLKSSPLPITITVVNDGSSSAEKRVLDDLVKKIKKEFLFLQPVLHLLCNQGKGATILAGWAAQSEASWYAFVDADGAVPAYEVLRIVKMLTEDSEKKVSLFASRIKMCGKKIIRSKRRHYSGRLFASLVGMFIDSDVYDSQCGFKIISQEAYQKIRPYLREQRFAFDVELLAALRHCNCPIEEIPIDWIDKAGSKVSLINDAIKMMTSVFKISSRMKQWR